uniref:Uncharacterized protein n=1 Tax=Rhizophora mucronata TaxID=61149 RepID=A0A2P2QIM4_RHIMU
MQSSKLYYVMATFPHYAHLLCTKSYNLITNTCFCLHDCSELDEI